MNHENGESVGWDPAQESTPADMALGRYATHHGAGTLRFRDPELERRYLQDEYSHNRKWTLGSVILGASITLLFYPLDELFIPPGALDSVHAIRLLVLAVMALIGFLGVLLIRQSSVAIPLLSVCMTLYGLGWTAIRALAGPISEPYVAFGVAQTILFAYACLGLPFRWSVVVVTLTLVPIIAIAATTGVLSADFWYVTASLLTTALIASYGAFRHDWASRERFLTQHRFETEYRRRLAVEHERSEWLSIIAGFTRHELKNAMAGIGSSLELLERSGMPDSGREYVGRAQRSLHFMRNILQQVANATSLDGALKLQEVEQVDLSRLVVGRVEDLRRDAGELRFESRVVDGVCVRGNPDSLVQMLDKLMNNAVEHSEPEGVIRVTLDSTPNLAILEVVNHGAPLPPDVASLFRPFVSVRRPDREGNLGLGLYIAKVIASHHGGTLRAQPTVDRPGAHFIVELPLLKQ